MNVTLRTIEVKTANGYEPPGAARITVATDTARGREELGRELNRALKCSMRDDSDSGGFHG